MTNLGIIYETSNSKMRYKLSNTCSNCDKILSAFSANFSTGVDPKATELAVLRCYKISPEKSTKSVSYFKDPSGPNCTILQ